jgi:hypothetical protein
LPWTIWPLFWIRFWMALRRLGDSGVAFILVYLAAVVLGLTVFEYKYSQLLLPLVPVGALLISYVLLSGGLIEVAKDKMIAGMAFPIILIGVGLAVLPGLPKNEYLPAFLWQLSPLVGVVVALIGIALPWLPVRDLVPRVRDMVTITVLLYIFVILGAGTQFDKLNNLSGAAGYIAALQKSNKPIAHFGAYNGQFHFAGRLRKPIEEVTKENADHWLIWNPQGYLITYTNEWQPQPLPGAKPVYDHAFRDHRIRIWMAGQIRAKK